MEREQFEQYFFSLDSAEPAPQLPGEAVDEFLADAHRFGYAGNGTGVVTGQEGATIRSLVRMVERQGAARLSEQGYVAGPHILGRLSLRGIMLYKKNGPAD